MFVLSGYICSTPGCSAAFDKFSKLAVHVRSHGKQLLYLHCIFLPSSKSRFSSAYQAKLVMCTGCINVAFRSWSKKICFEKKSGHGTCEIAFSFVDRIHPQSNDFLGVWRTGLQVARNVNDNPGNHAAKTEGISAT